MAAVEIRVEAFPRTLSTPLDLASVDVFAVNPTGQRPPVIHVLTWDEEAIGLPALLAQLATDQPVYVVYLGWSFGGVVALEVAQAHHNRRADGEGPIDVILVDSRNPQLTNDRPKAVSKAHATARLLTETLEKGSGKRWNFVRARIQGTWDRKRNQGVAPDDVPPLKRAIWVSWFKYVPRRYNVSGAVLWCDDTRDKLDDVALGWSRWWDGPFRTERVGHDHFAVYEHPAVANIAKAIERATTRSD